MTQNTEFSHSGQRLVRIKMAQAVLNMHALREEMQLYDLSSLQKSASAGRGQEQRIKYAALRLQYEIEKQAVGALIGSVLKAGAKGLKGLVGPAKKALGLGAGAATATGLSGHSPPPGGTSPPATVTRRARKSFVNPKRSAPAGAGAALGSAPGAAAALGGAAAGMGSPQIRKALSGSAPAAGAGAGQGGLRRHPDHLVFPDNLHMLPNQY